MSHIADNHDALLDYLYEEGDPAERLKIAEHLQECAACSVAVLEFQSVRGMLSQWAPPASELGFKIVQDAPAPPRRAVWAPARLSTFAQLAAGILLFVAGVAVSQVRVRVADGAVIVTTRPAAPAPSIRNASITLPPQTVRAADDVNTDQLRELLARLEGQGASSVDTEHLLQRVRAMIDQSEQRQQREYREMLALRLSQVAREVDTQHQADMLKIQQDFGRQQDATMEYLVRTSGGVK